MRGFCRLRCFWRFSRPCPWPQEVALDVTASEMAQPMMAARMLPGATPAAFPLPRPETLRTAHGRARVEPAPGGARPWAAPRLRWDGHPEDMDWTLATMAALRGPGASLVRTVPRDIADWCPGYEAAGPGQRRAFWAGLVSALAWHESTHARRRWAAAGAGSGWCRSRRRRRATGAARRPRAGASGRGGEPALRSQDHGGDGAARRRGVAGDARRGGRLGPVPFDAKARGHAAMAAGAGLLPSRRPRPCAPDHAACHRSGLLDPSGVAHRDAPARHFADQRDRIGQRHLRHLDFRAVRQDDRRARRAAVLHAQEGDAGWSAAPARCGRSRCATRCRTCAPRRSASGSAPRCSPEARG
jgi:hypothetical protein